jgi:hypothetical protein
MVRGRYDGVTAVVSRVIRDISAEEADFLVQNFSRERIQLGTASGPRCMLAPRLGGGVR